MSKNALWFVGNGYSDTLTKKMTTERTVLWFVGNGYSDTLGAVWTLPSDVLWFVGNGYSDTLSSKALFTFSKSCGSSGTATRIHYTSVWQHANYSCGSSGTATRIHFERWQSRRYYGCGSSGTATRIHCSRSGRVRCRMLWFVGNGYSDTLRRAVCRLSDRAVVRRERLLGYTEPIKGVGNATLWFVGNGYSDTLILSGSTGLVSLWFVGNGYSDTLPSS